MKQMTLVLLLLVGLPNHAEEKIELAKVPRVIKLIGKALLIDRAGHENQIKMEEILRERALIKTGDNSQVKIELDDGAQLIIQENSEVLIPVISWEGGQVKNIELKAGSLRAIERAGHERLYETPLSRDPYPSADFVLSYHQSGLVAFTLIQGSASFRGMENEEPVLIKGGERVSFKGVLESGELVFDVLLKGRRVARGKLTEVEKLAEADLQKLIAEIEIKQAPKPKAKSKPKRKIGEICEEPFGKLNDCVWRCLGLAKNAKTCVAGVKGVRCVRLRCHASGKWLDEYELPSLKSTCEATPRVGPCDY